MKRSNSFSHLKHVSKRNTISKLWRSHLNLKTRMKKRVLLFENAPAHFRPGRVRVPASRTRRGRGGDSADERAGRLGMHRGAPVEDDVFGSWSRKLINVHEIGKQCTAVASENATWRPLSAVKRSTPATVCKMTRNSPPGVPYTQKQSKTQRKTQTQE